MELIDFNLRDRTLHIEDYGDLIYLIEGNVGVWLNKKTLASDIEEVLNGGCLKQDGESETWLESYGDCVIFSSYSASILFTKEEARILVKHFR